MTFPSGCCYLRAAYAAAAAVATAVAVVQFIEHVKILKAEFELEKPLKVLRRPSFFAAVAALYVHCTQTKLIPGFRVVVVVVWSVCQILDKQLKCEGKNRTVLHAPYLRFDWMPFHESLIPW